jgi:WD40 repeat protein
MAGDNQTATISEWRTGTLLFALQHPQTVTSVEFSQDRRHLLTACEDGYARIWDTVVRAIPEFPEPALVRRARSDAPGRLFVLGDESNVARIWSQSAHRVVTNLTAGPKKLRAAAFHPRQTCSRPRGRRRAPVWDTATWKLATLLTNYWSPQEPSRTTAGGLAFGPVELTWSRPPTGAPMSGASRPEPGASLTNHTDWVTDAAFSADGRWLATACEDYSVRVWRRHPGPFAPNCHTSQRVLRRV